MSRRQELEKAKSANKLELEEIEAELKYEAIPENMRDMWKTQFGWPKISQSLGLRSKLDKETYEALYKEVMDKIEEIAKMVPPYEKHDRPCPKCNEIKGVLDRKYL